LDDRVFRAMAPYWRSGNPASGHEAGRLADDRVTAARETIARCLGLSPDEVVFTSGATESDNWAIKGFAMGRPNARIVTQATEHKAILESARVVAEWGADVVVLPVDGNGMVDLNQLWEATTPGSLVSIMAVNNETGVIQPMGQIAEICRDRDALWHCDAAQAFGRIPFNVRQLGPDLVSLSGHKIYGPKGIGALCIRRGIDVEPLLHGGRQERGRRAGTTNVPLVVGFAEAARLACGMVHREYARIAALCERLVASVSNAVPGTWVNGSGAPQAPGIVSLCVGGAAPERLLDELCATLCCSSGSACDGGEPSHVMKAMGVECAVLRVSVGRPTTVADVDRAAHAIVNARARSLVA
jgi:cysteine desulfurase